MDRSKWFADYWVGRPKIDDEGNEISAPTPQLLVDENGVFEEFQEITGHESYKIESEERVTEIVEYSEVWTTISRKMKDLRGWRCELCGFTSRGSSAIQTHHIDHDKEDNSIANLQVLCLICHENKHGSGRGMGEHVTLGDRAELDAWHRGACARERLRNDSRRNK